MDFIVHKQKTKLLDNVSVSISQSSAAIDINSYSLYCVQYVWSGFSGTSIVYLEGSNNNVNFVEVDKYHLSGSNGGRLINVEKAGYAYVRIRIEDPGTSSGTFSAILNGKVL